jgi:hypothetical protein
MFQIDANVEKLKLPCLRQISDVLEYVYQEWKYLSLFYVFFTSISFSTNVFLFTNTAVEEVFVLLDCMVIPGEYKVL